MKTRAISLLALCIGATLAVSGCYLDWGEWDESRPPSGGAGSYDDTWDYSSTTELDIRAGYLRGTMGEISFADNTWRNDGNDYGSYTNIEIETGTAAEGYAAMTVLDIQGGLDNPAFVPGASFVFDDSSYSSSLEVNVIGCSGPSSGVWTYDQRANHVDVRIDVGSSPNTQRFSYVATFDDGYRHQTTQGQFEYVVY